MTSVQVYNMDGSAVETLELNSAVFDREVNAGLMHQAVVLYLAGSSRSPIWRTGGVVFAPTPRSYGFKMPRKQRRIALASALTTKMRENQLVVLDKLELAAPKTKDVINMLGKFDASNALLVFAGEQDNVVKSARNIVGVEAVNVSGVNTYNVIITKDAVARLEEVLTNA